MQTARYLYYRSHILVSLRGEECDRRRDFCKGLAEFLLSLALLKLSTHFYTGRNNNLPQAWCIDAHIYLSPQIGGNVRSYNAWARERLQSAVSDLSTDFVFLMLPTLASIHRRERSRKWIIRVWFGMERCMNELMAFQSNQWKTISVLTYTFRRATSACTNEE